MPTLTIITEDNEVTYSSYTGSGPLAFTFPYFQKEDLNVDVDGVTISRSLWDDTPNPIDGGNDGGSIILTNGVAAKDVRIWRDTVRLRASQFGTGGATSRQIDTEFNRAFTAIQDRARNADELSYTQGEVNALLAEKASVADLDEKQDRIAHIIFPAEYGAVGNGSTNDAVALQAALTAAAGGILDLKGLTYRCDAALTGSGNTVVRNGAIDWSQGLAASGVGINFAGSLGSADTSLSAVAYADRTLTVTSNTGYALNQDVLILTDDIWSTDSSELRGQWAKVKSKGGGTILNLYGSSYDVYSTGRKLYKPTMIENIRFDDVRFIGRGNGFAQFGLRFSYAKNVQIHNCKFINWAYSSVEFYASIDLNITSSEASHGDDSIGASYGFAFYNCCERFSVTDGRGQDLRHFVTIGGTAGVSRFGTVKGCQCNAMTDSFLDAHPAAEFVSFIGNVGEHETEFDGDGIVYQGANGTIVGNQIISANTAGILVQPFAYHNRDSFVISDNLINRIESASGYGILVDVRTPVRAMTINGNVILSPVNQGINVQSNGGDLFGLVINGNSVTASVAEALYVQAVTTGFIQRVSVTGNVFHRANTSGPVVDFFAGTEGRGQYVALTGNTIINGTHSIRCDAEWERVLIVGNVLRDFLTAATELTGVTVTVNDNNLTS